MTRWTLRLLLYLPLGIVTTVGVAWGLALYVHFDAVERVAVRGWANEARQEGIDQVAGFYHYVEAGCELATTHWTAGAHCDPRWNPSFESLPAWAPLRRPAAPVNETELSRRLDLQLGYGWPLVAMTARFDRFDFADTSGAILLPSKGPRQRSRFLPMLPAWYGLVLDTLLFAALWLALGIAWTTTRRTIRRRRGRCPNCGYDLRYHHSPSSVVGDHHWERGGTSGCPECGWGRDS